MLDTDPWKRPCPTCELELGPNQEAVEWCTASGPTKIFNRQTDGDLGAMLRQSIVNGGYQLIYPALGYTEYTWSVIDWNQTALGKEVTLKDKGEWLDLSDALEMREDGNVWGLHVGRVCNNLDEVGRNNIDVGGPPCMSGNDLEVYFDGVRQNSWRSSEDPKGFVQCFECSLTPSYAMTRLIDGEWHAIYLPGMNSWTNAIWAMKNGWIAWPGGYPEDRSSGWSSSIDAVVWATGFGHDLDNPTYGFDDNGNWTIISYPERVFEWDPIPNSD